MPTTEPLGPIELHALAERLVAQAYVEPGPLAQLGAAFLQNEAALEGMRARDKRRGPKPAPPITEDGRLVARVLEHHRIGKDSYSLTDLAAECDVDRSQLSRCNSKTRPIQLAETLRTTLLWLLGMKTMEEFRAAGSNVTK